MEDIQDLLFSDLGMLGDWAVPSCDPGSSKCFLLYAIADFPGAGSAAILGLSGLGGGLSRSRKGFCHSFSGDTAVLMADGRVERISDIKVGDTVLATDPETGETGGHRVLEILPHTDQLLRLETSVGPIVTTEDHLFWNATDSQWQETQELEADSQLLSANGEHVTVEGLDWSSTRLAEAYDLNVASVDSYYVEAGNTHVLVHNCDGPLRGSAATSAAAALGYGRRIPAQKAPFNTHGQPVFFNGKNYISPDVDMHNGGVWKMFDKRGNRIGTYDANLDRIGN
jgi:hypothetical protein